MLYTYITTKYSANGGEHIFKTLPKLYKTEAEALTALRQSIEAIADELSKAEPDAHFIVVEVSPTDLSICRIGNTGGVEHGQLYSNILLKLDDSTLNPAPDKNMPMNIGVLAAVCNTISNASIEAIVDGIRYPITAHYFDKETLLLFSDKSFLRPLDGAHFAGFVLIDSITSYKVAFARCSFKDYIETDGKTECLSVAAVTADKQHISLICKEKGD